MCCGWAWLVSKRFDFGMSTRLKICLHIHLQGLWWRAARYWVPGARERVCKVIKSVMVTGHCPSSAGVGNGFCLRRSVVSHFCVRPYR